MEAAVFLLSGALALAGALGVVLQRNPVRAALSLVMTLFAIAVIFVAQEAYFLAAVQVIVYAGAVVVLFLFVIMLLGVDKAEDIGVDGLRGQRPAAAVVGLALLALLLSAVALGGADRITGARSLGGVLDDDEDIMVLAKSIFTDYVFAFELTSLLLVIAVVGAVVLARKPSRDGDRDGGS